MLQFWLSSHPPSRGRGSRYLGTHPAVHAGFLRSWLANGLNKCELHSAPACNVELAAHIGHVLHSDMERAPNIVRK